MDNEIYVIAHNIRSTHNVGSILRSSDGFGVKKVYLTGYTPYPRTENDDRLPHIADKLNRQIHKTALGAEQTVTWEHQLDVIRLVDSLKQQKITIVGLEQAPGSKPLHTYPSPKRVAILLGEEVSGIAGDILSLTDTVVEIPMFGQKESFNVSIAAAIALYHFRFHG